MKRLPVMLLVLIATLALTTSCDKEDAENVEVMVNASNLSEIVQQDSWKVTHYSNDSVGEETVRYHNLRFAFNADGSIVVEDDEDNTYNGTWQARDEAGTTLLVLDFANAEPLLDLGDNWTVVTLTSGKIQMESLGGTDYGEEQLVLEKI